MKKQDCPHSSEIKITNSDKRGCEARLPDGQVCAKSEHPRLCTSCGSVFCCESENAHNKEHFQKTDHPIIKALHTTYDFTWCYKCNDYLE